MIWAILVSDTAKRQLRKLKDSPRYELFARAISELAESKDPAALGTFKRGSGLRCYAYNVTGSFRLLYTIDRKNRTIILHAAGDHKQVYGKD
ncbi:MAG: type II toxin-antitoxin system RelE/ParE family toxin [Nitrososphaera sp.]|uniref:type II toxin-antitoxin system RelE family toxin n=1 Tax=Nitrososphaera sp. TaxID=1971748 RepID=UPI001848C6E7|nr:type II toxin-antitoxin system RelE/ParE family toxin [Nitrososphaera sp.]NWG37668.1 type II toxin-antitoxin system RelE/ParE family toxin [Nitrososphaera sp.]